MNKTINEAGKNVIRYGFGRWWFYFGIWPWLGPKYNFQIGWMNKGFCISFGFRGKWFKTWF